jgi:hypothetical protein
VSIDIIAQNLHQMYTCIELSLSAKKSAILPPERPEELKISITDKIVKNRMHIGAQKRSEQKRAKGSREQGAAVLVREWN